MTIAARDEAVAAATAADLGARHVCGDAGDWDDVQRIVADTVAAQGGLDVLCANAGACPQTKIADTEPGDWDDVLRTNLRSAFRCVKAAIAAFEAAGRRRVILTRQGPGDPDLVDHRPGGRLSCRGGSVRTPPPAARPGPGRPFVETAENSALRPRFRAQRGEDPAELQLPAAAAQPRKHADAGQRERRAEADRLEAAVERVLADGVRSADLMQADGGTPASTAEMGDAILAALSASL